MLPAQGFTLQFLRPAWGAMRGRMSPKSVQYMWVCDLRAIIVKFLSRIKCLSVQKHKPDLLHLKAGQKANPRTPPPFRLLNRENRKTYEFLTSNKQQIKSTKILHRESFEDLGVLEGVQALFDNIGWGQFLHNRVATYIEPTLEFLSTFKPDDEVKTVTFQMLGENRSLPFRVVNALMGTPVDHMYS
ncbi:unnamed protein product [Lactuca saligna]|uniref:Arabidopsis retrotransposon Orf1 C-terminal domain-containing protein n=1 Tax=Lactuca saligna TaxID=75948 RepID=A0AA35YCA8_LACSI|nr:unnamed protein product [Lactuca saligna]